MSGLRVNTLRGETSGSSPTFPDGVVVTGVTTATSFSGNVTGNVTGNVVGNVTGDVTGNITGTTGTFAGNVSVGGTLTYDDVTNVDSIGVVTARSGIRIGAGQSVSAVSGIVTYYGDGSQLSGVESGFTNFVASGAIANGQTVILKTDGTVGIVTQTGSATPSVGTPVVFESAEAEHISSTYDSTNNKVLITYRDSGNGGDGTAIVGTVSGSSISFGSAVVFSTNAVSYTSATFDTSNDKVVIAYKDDTDSNKGKAIVGTVSGTSISFGSASQFESGGVEYVSATFDSSNNKVVIAFRNTSEGNAGQTIVGTVSGSSISFGSAVEWYSGNTKYVSATFDSTNNKVVISYRDQDNSGYGKVVIGTVSGTGISYGTPVTFISSNVEFLSATYDSTNQKAVIAFRDAGNSDKGKAIVGTVSGTSISFGSVVLLNDASTTFTPTSAIFDSINGKVVIAFRDAGNSNYGTVVVGTVSGTSISFGSENVFESANSYPISATYDSSNNKVVIAYRDEGNSNYGTAVVFGVTSFVTNLTAENYIGIAAEAIANAATGKVNILGGVNSGQTGLTTAKTYYVQGNGTLATSAGSPSVVAGTSISNTKILIR